MKKSLVVLLFIFIALKGFSAEKYTGSLLWKISGNDLISPSYVLGTHHFVPASYVNEIPGYSEAWKSVDKVVGEVDLTDTQKTAAFMAESMMFDDSSLYITLLTEGERMQLENMSEKLFGGNVDFLFRFKPSALAVFYIQYLYSQDNPSYDLRRTISIDQYTQDRAKEENKTTGGLETIEEQVNLLFNYGSAEEQMKDLACAIDNSPEVMADMKKMTEYYFQARLWELYDMYKNSSSSSCEVSAEYMNMLLEERNLRWLQSIPAIMSKTSTLFVVGALHLPGEPGLLYKLDKMGYTVEPVN